jgi:predicted RNase H-like HicB family nuclease
MGCGVEGNDDLAALIEEFESVLNVISESKSPQGSVGQTRMTKHEIILYCSDEDQSFIAEVPELIGCAADGSTRQEALANVEVVIDEWIETAKDLGRPIPGLKGRMLFA